MTVKTFALIAGIGFLAAGVLGFVPALVTAPPEHAPALGITAFHGYLLGLFPVNFMHNLVHIAIGGWGIAASRSVGASRGYSRTIAVFYGLLAVMGLDTRAQHAGESPRRLQIARRISAPLASVASDFAKQNRSTLCCGGSR